VLPAQVHSGIFLQQDCFPSAFATFHRCKKLCAIDITFFFLNLTFT
jgi:hypothetical protein